MSVVNFPGKRTPEEILKEVIDLGVDDFAMTVVTKDGRLVFVTASTDKASILLMLEMFRHAIVSGQLDD